MNKRNPHLLFVDYGVAACVALRQALEVAGLSVTAVTTPAEIEEQQYDLILHYVDSATLAEDAAYVPLPESATLLISPQIMPQVVQPAVVGVVVLPIESEAWLLQVALALQNGRLLQETHKVKGELDRFTRTVAHDLKSPIATVVTMAEFLNMRHKETLGESGGQMLGRVVHNAEKAVALLDELMNFYRLKHVQPTIVTFDMKTAVVEALEAVACTTPVQQPAEWPTIASEQTWLVNIWQQLIDNACRFTENDEPIELGYTPMEEGIQFWVQDKGEGLPEDKQATLFEPFERLPQHKKLPGFGLGLAIVSLLVSRLEGSVGVESEGDVGSRFWFWLPHR